MSLIYLTHSPFGYLKLFLLVNWLVILTAATIGCKKFVDIDPPVSAPSSRVVFDNNTTAASVMTGLYADLSNNGIANGTNGISVIGGVAADELTAFPVAEPIVLSAYTNNLIATDNVPFWDRLYAYIYTTNTVLENLDNSPAITDDVKNQLKGEATFMRAFYYFYLVNFFGDVPLVLTSDYRKNANASRTDKAKVWEQIIADLKTAKGFLNPNYVEADAVTSRTTTERVRPNKWAATALLARAYLYTGDWANAETQASEVINNGGSYTLETDLNKVFLRGSKEAIWQLQGVINGLNTVDGYVFVLFGAPDASSPVSLSDTLVKSFELNDKRKILWVDSYSEPSGPTYYFANKYKVKYDPSLSEYLTVLRLSEQYLIRSEARAQQKKVSEGNDDLTTVRVRAGLPASTASNQTDLLKAIEKERKVELFTEWAHRWLDLKRTNRVNDVMSVISPRKGGSWNQNKQLFPIPFNAAILPNPNIVQNLGY